MSEEQEGKRREMKNRKGERDSKREKEGKGGKAVPLPEAARDSTGEQVLASLKELVGAL